MGVNGKRDGVTYPCVKSWLLPDQFHSPSLSSPRPDQFLFFFPYCFALCLPLCDRSEHAMTHLNVFFFSLLFFVGSLCYDKVTLQPFHLLFICCLFFLSP
jgi:hypothetical protein